MKQVYLTLLLSAAYAAQAQAPTPPEEGRVTTHAVSDQAPAAAGEATVPALTLAVAAPVPAAEEDRAITYVVQGRPPIAAELREARKNLIVFEERLASDGVTMATSGMCFKLRDDLKKKHGDIFDPRYRWENVRDDFLDDFLSKSFEANLGQVLQRYRGEARPEIQSKIDNFLRCFVSYNTRRRHQLIVNHAKFHSFAIAFAAIAGDISSEYEEYKRSLRG